MTVTRCLPYDKTCGMASAAACNMSLDGCRNSRRCLALGSDEAVGPVGAGGSEDSAAARGVVHAEGAGADPLVVPVLVCTRMRQSVRASDTRMARSTEDQTQSIRFQRPKGHGTQKADRQFTRLSRTQASGLSEGGARTPPSIARSPDSRAANRQDRECLRCSIAVCRHRQAVLVQLELAAVALIADDRLCREQNSNTGSAVVTEGIANAASSSERRHGVSGSRVRAEGRRRANRPD